MKKTLLRRALPTVLCILTVFLLAACGRKAAEAPAATPAVLLPGAEVPVADTPAVPEEHSVPTIPAEEQKRILENNRSLWEFADPYASPWFYTFTDLDHNGLLEVIAASLQGSGLYTYAHFYEVLWDGSGLRNCWHENAGTEGPDDWPDIIVNSLPCRYDAAADRCYYLCENLTRSGYNYQYYSMNALCLKDGTAEWELLAAKAVEWDESGEAHIACTDAAGNPISEQDYDTAAERRFAGLESSDLTLEWEEVLTPPDIPEKEPEPVYSGPAPVITKNPTSESLAVGGKTWFIAHAQNADRLTWQMTDPDGLVYSLEAAQDSNPGLKLEVLEGDTIAVSNVPLSVNGWAVQARFEGQGGVAVTEPAYLYVGDFVSAYGSVITRYKNLYESGSNQDLGRVFEQDLPEVCNSSAHVGYALKDLDKNGIPELIIAGIDANEFGKDIVYEVCTLENNTPVRLLISYARDRYYLRANNTIVNEGSSGAAYSNVNVYRVSGSTLVPVEGVMTYPIGQNGMGYYMQVGSFSYEPRPEDRTITADEFNRKWDEYKSSLFIPQLTRIA